MIRAIELVIGLLIPKQSENRRKKRLLRDKQPYQISSIYWAIFILLVPVIAHANERGIGVLLYVNRRHLERDLDALHPLYKSRGIAGLKFGFVQHGS